MAAKEEKPEFKNPIDGKKVALNPQLLPYAHERGAAVVKPVDRGKITGLAMTAMYEQTNQQLDQIRAQMELLAAQANEIAHRMSVSERIYEAEMNIDPIVNRTYYLYERSNGKSLLSLVSPAEWGPRPPYHYLATVRLLGDHTWEVIERREDLED
ncbi:hypothetical protein GGR26_001371 [Lewinella marina]|uniref:DUF2452 domain-containing protein n=1 Tax=Neolewinella marina TaxID=438751 RepID=A0A2G0CFE0_9BACT|nr:DUF2452 domain-containing protein [Neolewinella marina]NJB85626.1 hypothetical protein [Neolewinella marina]PHK98689.1 hypothetical protein CGL56_09490 [Neolewinella marina]